jgi:hypothetical protein
MVGLELASLGTREPTNADGQESPNYHGFEDDSQPYNDA